MVNEENENTEQKEKRYLNLAEFEKKSLTIRTIPEEETPEPTDDD